MPPVRGGGVAEPKAGCGALRRSEVRAGVPRRSDGQAKRGRVGGSNSVVESQPSKLLVAGSIPVSRSNLRSPLKCAGELRLASHPSLSVIGDV